MFKNVKNTLQKKSLKNLWIFLGQHPVLPLSFPEIYLAIFFLQILVTNEETNQAKQGKNFIKC